MRYPHWTNGPGKVQTRETFFVKKKIEKMVGNFATVVVNFTSYNSSIAKYGSDFTNFENNAKIDKKYFIWIKFVKKDLNLIFFHFQSFLVLKLKKPPRMKKLFLNFLS